MLSRANFSQAGLGDHSANPLSNVSFNMPGLTTLISFHDFVGYEFKRSLLDHSPVSRNIFWGHLVTFTWIIVSSVIIK